MRLLDTIFGPDGSELGFVHMLVRAVVVCTVALVLLRVASRRFLGRYSAFDWLFTIVLGSVLSRAINGTAALWPTIGVSAVLVAVHSLFGRLACRWPRFGELLHGKALVLIERGRLVQPVLRQSCLTRDDVLEELRWQAHTDRIEDVDLGMLERNGRISMVRHTDRAADPAHEAHAHRE